MTGNLPLIQYVSGGETAILGFKTAGFKRSPTSPRPRLAGKTFFMQKPKGRQPHICTSSAIENHVTRFAPFQSRTANRADGPLDCDENNLFHSERFRVY
jgi:hypothetical protein